jgi:hypothetical protein
VDAVPGVGGEGAQHVRDALKVHDMTTRRVGDDLLVEGSLTEEVQ